MLNSFYFDHLNRSEQAKYQTLISSIKKDKTTFKIEGILKEDTTIAVLSEHPELFFCNLREINYMVGPFTTLATVNRCISNKNKEEVERLFKIVESSLPNGQSELVIRTIHNYLIKSIRYDYQSGKSNVYEHIGHTVIGPLMYGKGVCEGISLIFKWILDAKGIDNTVVVGDYGDNQGIYHMWNVVSVQGRNYYIDLTQDIETTQKAWGKPSYMFYMLTDEEIRRDHTFTGQFNCHNTIDNPFYSSGRVFSNLITLEQYIRSLPASQRLINFKYTGTENKTIIMGRVQQAVARHPIFHRMSITENYGRYYCFKEV